MKIPIAGWSGYVEFKEDKPPIGIKPRYIWLEERAIELSRVIYDYTKYNINTSTKNYQTYKNIKEWLNELNQILDELTTFAKIKETFIGNPL